MTTRWAVGFGLGVMLTSAPAMAQQGTAGAGGVFVDAAGVVRLRESGPVARRPGRQKARTDSSAELTYVSLPRLFEEVRSLVQSGKPIPDPIRYLDGMVKLEYVFLEPGKDLVIAGPAETLDDADPDRPIGKQTGRPVLHFEDLVVALRTMGPGGRASSFGCSIDMPAEAINRQSTAASRIGAVRPGHYDAAARAIAEAVGSQPVRFINLEPDTRFAFVCLESDYIMKHLSLGSMRAPIRGFKSHTSMMKTGEPTYNRFWFTANYEPLLVSPDSSSYQIRGQGLAVDCSGSERRNVHSSASAERFAKMMTERFPELAEAIPAFADLRNLSDLAVLASLIRADDLHGKANWDMAWIQDRDSIPISRRTVATSVDSLASVKAAGQALLISVGGVALEPASAVRESNRQPDGDGLLARVIQRIPEGAWSTRSSR